MVTMMDENKEIACWLFGGCFAYQTARRYWITPFAKRRTAPDK
jgi:ribosomal protein S11